MAGVYIAVGLLASSLTENQIVAFIVGLLLMFCTLLMDKVLIFIPEFMISVVEYLGIDFPFLQHRTRCDRYAGCRVFSFCSRILVVSLGCLAGTT